MKRTGRLGRRLLRWMDSYTLIAFNPGQPFHRQAPRG
jgi:hypothetical protein